MDQARRLKLGNPNGAASLRPDGEGGVALRKAVSANADRFATKLAEIVDDIRARGGKTGLRAMHQSWQPAGPGRGEAGQLGRGKCSDVAAAGK